MSRDECALPTKYECTDYMYKHSLELYCMDGLDQFFFQILTPKNHRNPCGYKHFQKRHVFLEDFFPQSALYKSTKNIWYFSEIMKKYQYNSM